MGKMVLLPCSFFQWSINVVIQFVCMFVIKWSFKTISIAKKFNRQAEKRECNGNHPTCKSVIYWGSIILLSIVAMILMYTFVCLLFIAFD